MRVQFKKTNFNSWNAHRIVATDMSGSSLVTGSFSIDEKDKLLNYVKDKFPKFELNVNPINIQPGGFVEEELYFKFSNKEDEAYFILVCGSGLEI